MMPPKRKVKAGKMDTRKSRQPVTGHPKPGSPTSAETANTKEMNEALAEVLISAPTYTPHPDPDSDSDSDSDDATPESENAAPAPDTGTAWSGPGTGSRMVPPPTRLFPFDPPSLLKFQQPTARDPTPKKHGH